MQILYRTEIAWTAKALTEIADQLKRLSGMAEATEIERGSYQLRAEQLQGIAERLRCRHRERGQKNRHPVRNGKNFPFSRS